MFRSRRLFMLICVGICVLIEGFAVWLLSTVPETWKIDPVAAVFVTALALYGAYGGLRAARSTYELFRIHQLLRKD